MKNLINCFLLLAIFLSNVNVLLSNSFQAGKDISITSEVDGDLYLASDDILINAVVRGDLVCAGGEITVEDSIMQDVLMVGGVLKINGYVGDDVRIAGGSVVIFNEVLGDLIIAGGEVKVEKGAIIHGDINLVGGELKMNGTVFGKANIRGGEVIWNGIAENDLIVKSGSLKINGIVKGKAELAAQNINLGNDAQFYKDVEYWNSEGNLDFGSTLLGGATSFYNDDLSAYESDMNWQYLGVGIFMFWLYRLLVGALMIGLGIWMFHKFFSRNVEEINRNYFGHLGMGIIYVIGLPLLILLAFMTMVGIPVGFILMMFYGLTLGLGHILASLLIAYGWNNFYEKKWNRRTLFFAAMLSSAAHSRA